MLDFRVETFLVVCQTMNFTRAAELLHITQPAVSQHIHTLEERYATKLFQYQGKQLQLTESGRLFLRTAVTMHHDALHLKEAIHQQGLRHRLRFGATLTIGEYIMPQPLLQLLEQKPELQLRMLVANTQELLGLLDQGELDFAIVEGYFDQQAYDSRTYCTQRYLPVCAPQYSFSRPIHQLKDLLEEHLLVREPGSGTRNVLERALEARNLSVSSFHRITELGSLNVIRSLVCAGAGISFFYQPVVQKELATGQLREIPLEDCAISHDFSFLWRKGSIFSQQYLTIFQLLQGNGALSGQAPAAEPADN